MCPDLNVRMFSNSVNNASSRITTASDGIGEGRGGCLIPGGRRPLPPLPSVAPSSVCHFFLFLTSPLPPLTRFLSWGSRSCASAGRSGALISEPWRIVVVEWM
ncbi:hypothetical protein F2Q68_00026200 [Brassica cretica]|uniref:Uncharacterized protein n=1 Tax=Brassica cretica TaxID=69181 RepID=A0A8S9IHL0_BRACR|nr:hypothetical protein F2Q68_00026200 [Brassica cretica]